MPWKVQQQFLPDSTIQNTRMAVRRLRLDFPGLQPLAELPERSQPRSQCP